MNTLLIDNGTTLIKDLEKIVPGNITVHTWNELDDVSTESFDLIILSGGSQFEIEGNEERLHDEIQLIMDDAKPLIGICFGCELIVTAFGGTIEEMGNNKKGPVTIEATSTLSTLLDGMSDFTVYENHHWRIQELPEGFEALAHSDHGIEVIKHKHLPIVGLQFHPEKVTDNNKGKYIFEKLLKEILRG